MAESSTLEQPNNGAENVVGARAPRVSLIAAALAALGASVCCIVPFALIVAGIGGAWMSYFTAFEPYRPVFIGVTSIFLGLAFWRLYLVPRRCEASGECVDKGALLRSRRIFWVVTVVLVPVLTFPWYFTYLLDVWGAM